jgi:uncharacterized protein (TIRG00374 family)
VVGGMLMLPGGVGAVEATMIGLYATLGTPTDVGFIVVLSYRVISFWIPTLLGLVAAPYLERASLQGRQVVAFSLRKALDLSNGRCSLE